MKLKQIFTYISEYLKSTKKNLLIKAAIVFSSSLLLSFVCGKALYSDAGDILGFSILISCMAAVLGMIFGNLTIGSILTFVPAAILGTVSSYKLKIAGTPLSFADLSLIGKAASILELNKSAIVITKVAAVLVMLAIIIPVLVYYAEKKLGKLKISLKSKLMITACFVLVFILIQPFTSGYGSLLNIWCDAIPSINVFSSKADISNLLARLDENEEKDYPEKQPNVIVILSESFFDVTELDGVTYDEDPISAFHELQKESLSGKFYTRTLGYGTCSIEMEILTGINTCYLGKDQYISEWDTEKLEKNDSVPELYAQQGYSSVYLHSFNDSIYDRSRILPSLGFEKYYFSGDYKELLYGDRELTKDQYYNLLVAEYLEKDYYSDMLIADSVIKLCENTDEPLFCFATTVGNHTPFEAGKYDEYDYSFTADLSEEATDSLNALTQGVANASEMLKKLTDYFRDSEEPTIIVFFGDHKPNLPLSDDSTVYEELGIAGTNVYKWSYEETETMLTTDYLIWSNDAAYMPEPAGTTKNLSVNFLGLDILNLGNIPLTEEWKLLKAVRSDYQCWSLLYIVDSNGKLQSIGDYIDNKEKYNVLKQIKAYYIEKYK